MVLNLKKITPILRKLLPWQWQRRITRRAYKARSRYRVEIINENTLGLLMRLRLSGVRVTLAALAVVAAVASLILVLVMFTPLGTFLPGQLRGDLRSQYAQAALRIDSLEQVSRRQTAYMENIRRILTDSVSADLTVTSTEVITDSLVSASTAERQFVRRFEDEQRFNLSVLAPIAAEGMIFEAPTMSADGTGEVSAIYRGTVLSTAIAPNGLLMVMVQHPNDFVSIYNNLEHVYIAAGDKVVAGQRIACTAANRPLALEMWHDGVKLSPELYLPY